MQIDTYDNQIFGKKKREKKETSPKSHKSRWIISVVSFCGRLGKKTSVAYKLKLGILGARVGVSFFGEFTSLDLLRCPVVDRKQIHIYNKSFGEFYRYTRFANKSGVDEHVAKLKNSVNEV